MAKIESVKSTILKEAAALFSEQGYERTSMREIAERVGVSKPAIYYHFANKQALFEELINTAFELSKKRIEEIAKTDFDSITKLKYLAIGFFESTKNNPEFARFMHDLSAGNIRKNIILNHHEVFSKQQEWFNQILTEGKVSGLIKTDLDNYIFTMAYIGTINMFTIGYLKGELKDLSQKQAEQIVNLLLNGIKK